MSKKFKFLSLVFVALFLVVGVGAMSADATLTLEALTITSNGALNLNSAATSDITIGSTLTTGKVILGGTLQMGTNNITSTGSLGATGARLTKGWFTNLEITNLPTINGGTLATALNLSGTNTGDNATNSQYSGLAASKADVGQTFYIGTTQVAINRASAALTLAGLTLTTPDIGVATATSVNKVAITAPATGSTLTIAEGKTLTVSNTLTFSGTDSSTLNVGTGGTLGTAAYTAATAYQPLATNLTTLAGVKVYRALLTQTGTNAPVVTVLENSVGNIVWTRSDLAEYNAALSGAFLDAKTFLSATRNFSPISDPPAQILFMRLDDNNLRITTRDSGGARDEMLLSTPVEILVYP